LSVATTMDSDIDERSEVKLFREYLRIKSVQPNPDYVSCVSFLQKIAASYNLEFTCLEVFNSYVKKSCVFIAYLVERLF